jgi:uncharacterized membrane protein
MEKQIYNPSTMKRIQEIDLLKAIAIIAMVFIHVYDASTRLSITTPVEASTVWIVEFMGNIPSAGVFMFAMGWGAAFSSRSTPKTYLSRLRQLVILGVVINFFEQYIPSLIDPAHFGSIAEIAPSIIAVDIYFFAAFAMIYFALMKGLKNKAVLAVGVSVLIVAVCFTVNWIFGFETFSTGNNWLDTLIGLFIRENKYSFFPFVSWIVFPIVGYGAAKLFKTATERKSVLIFSIVIGTALIAFAEIMMYLFNVGDVVFVGAHTSLDGEYYSMHPLCAVCGIGLISLEFAAANLIMMAARQRLAKFLSKMSKNVMEIYIAQWVLIGFLSPVLILVKNLWVNLLIGVVVLIGSYFGAELYIKLMLKLKARKEAKLELKSNN